MFCDVVFVGVEDIIEFFDIESVNDVLVFCELFGVSEIVIKNGFLLVFIVLDGECLEYVIVLVVNVVDIILVGDVFNGVYLGGRFNDVFIFCLVEFVVKVVGIVI